MKALPALLVAASTVLAPSAAPLERLDRDHEPLVQSFDESRGRVRLLTILSPT